MATQIRALKRFGQNFLKDISYAQQIINALECQENDSILEIGAGKGALTELLLQQNCARITALEVDSRLVEFLNSRFSNELDIVPISILDFSIAQLAGSKRIKVVGNIPYNITSHILFKMLDNHTFISRAILMVQKEVADRLLAKPRTKDYGILTILLNSVGEVRHLTDISRTNFSPAPNVDSTVVILDFNTNPSEIEDFALFRQIVNTSFQARRKKLRNSLKKIMDSNKINSIKTVSLDLRPEELTVAEFQNLTNEIYSSSQSKN
jgi:16S rRNA (adenine1518-N6/adenine1519-N6)-dimethyltransferase